MLGLLHDRVVAAATRTFEGTGEKPQLFSVVLRPDNQTNVLERLEVFVQVRIPVASHREENTRKRSYPPLVVRPFPSLWLWRAALNRFPTCGRGSDTKTPAPQALRPLNSGSSATGAGAAARCAEVPEGSCSISTTGSAARGRTWSGRHRRYSAESGSDLPVGTTVHSRLHRVGCLARRDGEAASLKLFQGAVPLGVGGPPASRSFSVAAGREGSLLRRVVPASKLKECGLLVVGRPWPESIFAVTSQNSPQLKSGRCH